MAARRTIFLGLLAASVLFAGSAVAQGNEPLALKGYDPVAYFTDHKPMPGVEQYELAFDGQRYRFTSARHRELFKASPDKYAPQFGGLCAMNLSRGVRRESDPHNWVISNGNLYVFAGERGAQNFSTDAAAYTDKAATHYKTLKTSATQ
ncbi:MAG TPA: YHS domain-containing (seleno)protein [Reyranella sp.]|nr:YHS domain-containing (seleno)protein [Reyranella sp.]